MKTVDSWLRAITSPFTDWYNWALVCLLVGAASSAFAAKTYTDNGDGTVTDPTTGLTWMRCSMGQTWTGGTCTGTASTYTWDQANALSGTVTFAGQGDWRGPNIRELQTILDRSRFPTLDSVAFPNTVPYLDCWSVYAGALGSTWSVNFYGGGAGVSGKASALQVRLVRGGQSFSSLLNVARPSSDYVDHGDGTATHTPTKLMWKRCAEGQQLSGSTCTGTNSTFTAAQAASLSASYAGHADWRTPTVDELDSLVDYSAFGPSINTMIFPVTSNKPSWSASVTAYDSNYAWIVGFTNGGVYSMVKTDSYQVRLVRSAQSIATTFALSAAKTGAGTLTSTPAGIACGSTCNASFASGTIVTLTATPDAGDTFSGWSGACSGSVSTCTVTMTAAQSVTATFNTLPVVVSRFKDNRDGTVTDPTTGLLWMRCSMGQTWSGGTCTGTAPYFTWEQANALTGKQTFAGQSDWRVPNIRELQTTVDRSRFNPAIDPTVFPNTPPRLDFWSTSLVPSNSSGALVIYVDNGLTSSNSVGLSGFVRLVRGGQSFGSLLNIARPGGDYVDNANGTVTHTPTKLMWKRCPEGQVWGGTTCAGNASTFTADQAATLSASFAGQSDWRTPTVDELLSLADYSTFRPAINTTVFPATQSVKFWSTSADTSNSTGAWSVDFYYGTDSNGNKSESNQVRLVRSAQSIATFALSASKTGAGTITSTPAAIACGSTCSASFTSGTNITLTATPDAGSTFTGWSGACAGSGSCVLTMNAAKSVVATFKAIPFTVATTGVAAGVISAGVATVTNKITFNSTDVGKTGSVFVTAVVPSSFLNNLSSAGATLRAMAVAAVGENTATSNLVLVQLTSTGWKQVVNGQLIPYSTGVLGDQLAAQTILTNTNTSSLPGAQFCVGYGTSAAEMSEAGRMQLVATVPDASATSASRQSCLVTDTLQVQTGWNLLGNSRNQNVQAASVYSDAAWVTSVWKWDAAQKKWQIYAPSMDTATFQKLIADKGYGVLGEIKPGDGYWVQATAPASVVLQSGASFNLTSAALSSGWNLVTTATSQAPGALNASLGSLTSLWAWDGTTQAWYFYAPSLDSGTALADYARTNGYLDFAATGKTLGSGVGFWFNRP